MIDVVRENEDEIRKVREFLYVDLQRIRSYYAQLNRGIVESVVRRDTDSKEGEAEARLFGFGGSVEVGREREREEARSLQDLNYVIFEELFEKEGLIKDIDEVADDITAWSDGRLHGALSEGDIIRYTGSVQILDPKFAKDRIEQIIRFATALTGIQVGEQPAQPGTPPVRTGKRGGSTRPATRGLSSDEARDRVKELAVQQLMGGQFSIAQIEDIAEAVGAFTNETISVRILPHGIDHLDYHFAGTLLSRNEYIQEEREALFSRYGSMLRDWTVVMQVARIPEQSEAAPDLNQSSVDNSDRVNRAAFENLVINLISYMEKLGFAEASSFPAISTTILAIYREFA